MPEAQAEAAPADPMEMLVRGYPDQFAQAMAAPLPDLAMIKAIPVESVVFAGMGGSGTGGEFAAALLAAEGKVPAVVAHDYALPAWVGPKTLVIATSYSGGTEETLAGVAAARAKGASWIAITSGGALAEAATLHGAPLARVREGFPPRAAFGHLTVTSLRILAALGLIDAAKLGKSLQTAHKALRGIRDEETEGGQRMTALAANLGEAPIALYADTPYAPVAERVRCQLNENSKRLAFTRILPECNHNDTVAWGGDPRAARWRAVLVGAFDRSPAIAARAQFVREVLGRAGVSVFEFAGRSGDPLAAMLGTAYLGDWLSVRLAQRAKVDAMDVTLIASLKAKVESTGIAAKARRDLGLA